MVIERFRDDDMSPHTFAVPDPGGCARRISAHIASKCCPGLDAGVSR